MLHPTKLIPTCRNLFHTCGRRGNPLLKRVDYYDALGVTKTADGKSIKVAYFRLAKKYHPDFNPSPTAAPMFEMISEAYEVLSDPHKKKNYDEFGTAGETFGGSTRGPGRKRGDTTYTSKELFERIFRQQKSSQGRREDILEEDDYEPTAYGSTATVDYNVQLSFEEAARGCIYELMANHKCICYKCDGGGSEWGFQGNICPYCEGTGYETEKVGHVATRRPCAYCNGTAIFKKFKCMECAGAGQLIWGKVHQVEVPAGVENGEIIQVAFDQELVKWSVDKTDRFYIKVMVQKSDYFRREGFDVHTKADIDVHTALYGGEIEVKSLYEPLVKVKIPPGTSSHQTITLPGHGIRREGLYGNQIVEIGIDTLDISERDKTVLEDLKNKLNPSGEESTVAITPILHNRSF